jgi:carboxypeptidase family protein
MKPTRRTLLAGARCVAALAMAACLGLNAGSAWADVQYLGDGAIQDNGSGGWDLPPQGTCPAAVPNGYTGIDTRPECTALRLNIAVGSCTGNYSWTTGGVCNDLVNTTQAACQAAPDRLWNPSTGVCAIVMLDDDRNNVTCAVHGGTWVTAGTCTGNWIMPARTAYTPNLLTGNGPGDQCLRCHNTVTQYNSPRVRDTEDTLYMGHKNMARKVVPGMAWGGPPFSCSNSSYTNEEDCIHNGASWNPEIYPSDDSGNMFDWDAGTIKLLTDPNNPKPLYWIYGDWLSALPRAIYSAGSQTSGSNIGKPLMSYSCARCHTTGWTSDATIRPSTGIDAKEPEASFPGVTWDGVTLNTTGKVNLASGVTGDTNKFASWDQFGIMCTRCHSSAIDTTKGDPNSIPTQYSSPTGMSSHHSNLTSPDNTSGVCSDTRFTAEAQCTSNGGLWLTNCSTNPTAAVCTQAITTQAACVSPGVWVSAPGWCSNAFYTDSASCTANSFTWQDGWCTRPDLTTSTVCTGGSGTNQLTWRLNGTQASCQAASATWASLSKCSVEGVCNKNPLVNTTPALCAADLGQFAYATDIIRCGDAGGRWTGNNTNRGQMITSLCMQCHRQETGGLPYDSTNPAGVLKVGPAHSTVGFVSHPHGNQFLNSPHGQFTGTFSQIGTAKLGSGYGSQFQNAAEAANTGNGCTGCHEVHTSTVVGEEPFRAECTECHSNISLTAIAHLGGTGTPLEFGGSEACITCHMPGGMHLWRINPNASYSTFPAAAVSSTVNANTSPAGSYANAVWVDLDLACGQCHGGGTNQATTTGTTNANDPNMIVASTTGFAVGQRIKVVGAGSLYYDDIGMGHRADLESYVKSINGTTITLAGNPTVAVTDAATVQNPTTPGAPYFTKAYLATVAVGMHDSSGVTYAVTFSTAVVPGTLTVNTTASVDCGSGVTCPSFEYDWDWGDTLTSITTVPDASHTYTSAGTKSIRLDLRMASGGGTAGSVTRSLTLIAPDLPPVVGGTCTWNANTWTQTVQDTSADDGPDADTLTGDGNATLQIVVDWGDGSTKSIGGQGALYSHTYIYAGTFTAKQRAIDSILQTSVTQCAAVTSTYFSISGTVKNSAGTGLASAAVTVKKGTTAVKTVYTAANGTYSAGSLRPGSYTLTVTKSGYTFPVTGPVAIGPNATGIDITASARSTLLMGAVKDWSGTGLGSAVIRVMSGKNVVKVVRTSADGRFSIDSLKPGTYTVVVRKRGYRFAVPRPIELRASGVRLLIKAIAP